MKLDYYRWFNFMQKIVNAHCHIYPEKIADKAVTGIRDFYDLDMSLN